MDDSLFDTVTSLLESVIDETDDTEVHFKLRTALQLLVVLRTRHADAMETLEEADLDAELRDRLRDLGYVE